MRLTSLLTILWLLEPVTSELLDGNNQMVEFAARMYDIPVHVHVMTAEIERNQELEDERIVGIRRRQIYQEPRCCTPEDEHFVYR